MTAELIRPDEIAAAAERIRAHILRTPLVPMWAAGVLLKSENLQRPGSFKARGAFNSILTLTPEERAHGVVAHSSGNHAVAVALAGSELGVPVTVVMPEDAPATKVERTRALGARVEVVPSDSEARKLRADELARSEGLSPIEPYDSRAVLAATATIAIEVLDDVADGRAPVIYVPISGGGLAGGVAAGAKRTRPDVRVVGVEPEVAADALASRRAGRPVRLPGEQMAGTIADGLRVRQVGALPWQHMEAFVDDIVTVTEDEILDAMRRTALEAGLVAEPSGAVPVAAALAGRGVPRREVGPVVAVLTGGNVDAAMLRRAFAG